MILLASSQSDDEMETKNKLSTYQRIYVNNAMILLNRFAAQDDDDYDHDTVDRLSLAERVNSLNNDNLMMDNDLHIFHGDHLQYECDIPIEDMTVEWKLNDQLVSNASDSMFTPSDRLLADLYSKNMRRLKVSCSFDKELTNGNIQSIELIFPHIVLSAYKFDSTRSYVDFLLQKYRRPIIFLKIFVLTFVPISVLMILAKKLFQEKFSEKHNYYLDLAEKKERKNNQLILVESQEF